MAQAHTTPNNAVYALTMASATMGHMAEDLLPEEWTDETVKELARAHLRETIKASEQMLKKLGEG